MPRLDTPPDPAPELPAGEVAAADGFTALDLDPRLLGTLGELGYEEPRRSSARQSRCSARFGPRSSSLRDA